jgi:hypothetical protein
MDAHEVGETVEMAREAAREQDSPQLAHLVALADEAWRLALRTAGRSGGTSDLLFCADWYARQALTEAASAARIGPRPLTS